MHKLSKNKILIYLTITFSFTAVLWGCNYNNSTANPAPTQEVSMEFNEIAPNYEETHVSDTLISENTKRIVFKEEFYYEPLSEDVKQRITGVSYGDNCTVPYEDLCYVSVLYKDFQNAEESGELICNKAIAQDLVEIFYELYQADYPIEQIRLIDEYGADDILSMLDNNSSCFNFREIEGSSTLSKHALGLAIDINPFYNPYVTYPNGVKKVSPETAAAYANRSDNFAFKIDHSDLCYRLFKEHGFTWGGDWNSVQDYQHFQKEIN